MVPLLAAIYLFGCFGIGHRIQGHIRVTEPSHADEGNNVCPKGENNRSWHSPLVVTTDMDRIHRQVRSDPFCSGSTDVCTIVSLFSQAVPHVYMTTMQEGGYAVFELSSDLSRCQRPDCVELGFNSSRLQPG